MKRDGFHDKRMGTVEWLRLTFHSFVLIRLSLLLIASSATAGELPATTRTFLESHCYDCHSAAAKEGGLDLESLKYDAENRDAVEKWILIHDRVKAGEMPPKTVPRPPQQELAAFVSQLHSRLDADDRARIARDGRATQRRLNVDEYENALRDLLHAPWLALKSKFPPDGEAAGYNKSGAALSLSHVQMERYLSVAEFAIDEVMQQQLQQSQQPTPTPLLRRSHARDQEEITTFFTGSITFIPTNIDRRPIPVLDVESQPDVRLMKAPHTVGDTDPAQREREALAFVSRYHEGFRPNWNAAKIPVSGNYRLRVSGYTLKVAAGQTLSKNGKLSGQINLDAVSRGERSEPVKVYALRDGDIYFGERREVGAEFDLTPEPTVHEIGPVWLRKGEVLVTDPVRLFRAPPPGWKDTKNPLLTDTHAPAVAFRWIELEGPLPDENLKAGRELLFGDLQVKALPLPELAATEVKAEPAKKVDGVTRSLMRESGVDRPKPAPPIRYEVVSANSREDARRLMREFVRRAYRRAVDDTELDDFVGLVTSRLDAGATFAQALIAGYKAVLSSPGFLLIEEPPGPLTDDALATRLAFFLWNSPPDTTLRQLAAKGELRRPEVLRAETERLLADAKSQRFVNAFLDYWLDLRKRNDTEPSGSLYNDYFLDDFLAASAVQESRLFFADVVARDLPARNVVASDFTFANERLARHYGLPGVEGIAMRRVSLPQDSVRGGFLTQAAVLKVTACGTTTSPVVRGKFINERIMGIEIPKPPPSVPAVEPDIRGATTLRQQLDKHRTEVSCAGCHIKIDPPGFALESFDVMGGFRERYRAVDESKPGVPGHGYDGVPFAYHQGPAVDATGEFADGTPFRDIREFKAYLLKDEPALARNLARHLGIYATGAPISYSDRAALDAIIQSAAASDYGVRSLIHAIVQSRLFRNK